MPCGFQQLGDRDVLTLVVVGGRPDHETLALEMRVLIATTGSDGDIRPFFPLAKELMARCHEVLFAAPDHYAVSVAEQGLAFRKIGPPWIAKDMERVFERVLTAPNPLAGLPIIMEIVAEQGRPAVPELLEMASQADVVIHPPLLVAAAAAARAKDVPQVSVQFAPVYRGCGYAPNGANFGPFLNGLAWSLAYWLLRRTTDARLNTVVEAAGLAPWKNVFISAASPLLDLIAVSPHVFARDPAWPMSAHVTGYFFNDEAGRVGDAGLEAFVGAERPVVIGFGSMLGFDPHATTRTILEAAAGLRSKVVVQAGWAGLGASDPPPNVFFSKFIPHGWLFSRAACVVHHGGAGTTAAAFRAGVPQAVVWHLGDQPGWGKKACTLGVSPGFVSYKKLTATWLRSQIERMCDDARMRDAARSLGEAIRQENGVGTAATLIERTVGRGRPPPEFSRRDTALGDAVR
jgi:sterol 3beta-glucosyltransferase